MLHYKVDAKKLALLEKDDVQIIDSNLSLPPFFSFILSGQRVKNGK